MAFDTSLADRVRTLLAGRADLSEKRMFGGLAFLRAGNMTVGLLGADLIVRVGSADYEPALADPGVRPFDLTGRPMRGWVVVGAGALEADDALREWVERAWAFAGTLPGK